MEVPTMLEPRTVAQDTEAFLSFLPLPTLGLLPANSFLIRSAEPVLVDTNMAPVADEYVKGLSETIDPADIRWIWLTHLDPDHIGNLRAVLDMAPDARIVTTFLGMGKMGLLQLPVDRAFLLNPGQSLDVGDRTLLCIKPPSFDAPETTAIFDTKTQTLFSADSFGAPVSKAYESAADMQGSELLDGITTWAMVDAPWISGLEPQWFDASIDVVRRLKPETVLSSHLPPAQGMTARLLNDFSAAREMQPFEGPDQAELERMMAAMAVGEAAPSEHRVAEEGESGIPDSAT